MPDPAKFARLREIGYSARACGNCVHGPDAAAWGECRLHRYEHERQSNPEGGRGVSVHVLGRCLSWEGHRRRVAALGAHVEFAEGPDPVRSAVADALVDLEEHDREYHHTTPTALLARLRALLGL